MITGYAAAKIVNAALAHYEVIDQKTGETKEIPPQMIYTYVSKGYIPSTDKKIKEGDLQEWLKGYLLRNGVKFEEQNENDKIEGQEELDLEGAMK